MDLIHGPKGLEAETVVRIVQPYGCPKNGTMGQCYVETLGGKFIGMVCVSSVSDKPGTAPSGTPLTRLTAQEAK